MSGYPAIRPVFSGIYVSDKIVGDIRPDSLIITKIELFSLVAKHTLENQNMLEKLPAFTSSQFKIKAALTQMKSNLYCTTVPFMLIHLTLNRERHHMLPVYI